MGEMGPFLINVLFSQSGITIGNVLPRNKRKHSHAGNGMFPHWEHDVPTMGISASRRAGLGADIRTIVSSILVYRRNFM